MVPDITETLTGDLLDHPEHLNIAASLHLLLLELKSTQNLPDTYETAYGGHRGLAELGHETCRDKSLVPIQRPTKFVHSYVIPEPRNAQCRESCKRKSGYVLGRPEGIIYQHMQQEQHSREQ
jgi:hypothetical protein